MPQPTKPNGCPPDILNAHKSHPRRFRQSRLIYPVLSRRSRGISVGVNLSPHKRCNFDCPYCQVDRTTSGEPDPLPYDLEIMEAELRQTILSIMSGDIYSYTPFDETPAAFRRLNDIALSGDGEPTAEKDFLATCRVCARVKAELGLEQVKLVLITNATRLHRSQVQQGLEILDRHQGQIWAKLDAGSDAYYRFINKTSIPFRRVLDNLLDAARVRPIVIQSLFVRFNGEPIDGKEVAAYAQRIDDILQAGGQITAIQLHTIARPPADGRLTGLSPIELDQIAGQLQQTLTLPIQTYYGDSA